MSQSQNKKIDRKCHKFTKRCHKTVHQLDHVLYIIRDNTVQ